jgi:hypothetical protein
MRLSPLHARSRRCQHARARAVERVLFGGWGRTHTRWAGRPSSPVIGAAACTPHRLSSACRAGSHPAMRAAFSVAVARFEAGHLAATRGGFLRFAPSAAGFVRCALCTPTSCVRVGANPALGPRLHEVGPRKRCVAVRGRPGPFASAPAPAGAARCPSAAAPSTATHPPALPTEGGESPSAVTVPARNPGRHRSRRASAGALPHQGRALQLATGQPGHSRTPGNQRCQRCSATNSSRWRS